MGRIEAGPQRRRALRRGDLLARLDAALADDGADPAHPTIELLAPYDQFHGRGLEATVEAAAMMQAAPGDHLLDVGSGIGGTRGSRRRFRCKVTGIDLTPEFCDVARHLTRRLGMDDRVAFEVGDALAMPFPDDTFDGAWSMNVSMNVADKGALYREIRRVLRPGAWLVLSEIAKGAGAELDYPTPWAAGPATSFLSTPDETRRGLSGAGFDVIRLHESRDEAGVRRSGRARSSRAAAKPPHRAVMLIHGDAAKPAPGQRGARARRRADRPRSR